MRSSQNSMRRPSQFSLGIMYKNGEDVPQDYMQAQM